jgi:uncharacterized protein
MATLLIAVLGTSIGFATGLLGAGGSFLTVLLLDRVGGLGLVPAITTSLVVVAGMSLVALVPYALTGAVVWRAALGFGIASMAGAFAGGRIATLIPARVLLVIFLVTMLAAGAAMFWQRPPPSTDSPHARREPHPALMVAAGLLLGSLTGMVGLGGGFAVVPLLVVFAGTPVRSAVGTSILVIAMNTLAGLAGHLPHPPVDWRVAAYLGIAESAGGLAGVRLARRVSATTMRRAFAGLMLMGAALLLVTTLLRPTGGMR